MPGLEHKDERLHAVTDGALDRADLTVPRDDSHLEGADWRDRLAALRAQLDERPDGQPT